MSGYSNAVRQLMTSGKTQAEAERTVRREQPHLYTELLQQADDRRNAQRSRGRRSALPSSTPPAAETPDINAMLARAIGGEHFTDAQIFAAVRPINRSVSWFRNEVARECSHLERVEQERSAPAPVRKPARVSTHDLVAHHDHHGLTFVLPTMQAEFEAMCR